MSPCRQPNMMTARRRVVASLACMILGRSCWMVDSFRPSTLSSLSSSSIKSSSSSLRRPSVSFIVRRMSDVPQDPEDAKKNMKKNDRRSSSSSNLADTAFEPFRRKIQLPPPPEDRFILIGDLLSLFVYSFSDHFVCRDLAMFFASAGDSDKLNHVIDSSSLGMIQPVWLDASSSYNAHVLQVIWNDATVTQYSPLLQQTGLAACVMASCWLLSGWWHQAFAYRNTLDCSTPRTLVVTAKAWLTASLLLMTVVAITSNLLTGNITFIPEDPSSFFQMFTRGDVAYIWDSLTVLCVWRFMASSLLGSGSDNDL